MALDRDYGAEEGLDGKRNLVVRGGDGLRRNGQSVSLRRIQVRTGWASADEAGWPRVR
jgi:hypothetical protein